MEINFGENRSFFCKKSKGGDFKYSLFKIFPKVCCQKQSWFHSFHLVLFHSFLTLRNYSMSFHSPRRCIELKRAQKKRVTRPVELLVLSLGQAQAYRITAFFGLIVTTVYCIITHRASYGSGN